jgi:hypothetical protein
MHVNRGNSFTVKGYFLTVHLYKLTMPYIRKTHDIWAILGFYGGQWEEVTQEVTRKEALVNLKAYRENEHSTMFKLKKQRVKNAQLSPS